jgi:hypothetical protein
MLYLLPDQVSKILRHVVVVQVTESRVSDLTSRLASAEEKVTALKGERSRLYQQLAESSSASRTQVNIRIADAGSRQKGSHKETASCGACVIQNSSAPASTISAGMRQPLRMCFPVALRGYIAAG